MSVGQYLIYTLDRKLFYDVDATITSQLYPTIIIPSIVAPLLLVIIVLLAVIVALICFYGQRTKENSDTNAMKDERYNKIIILT